MRIASTFPSICIAAAVAFVAGLAVTTCADARGGKDYYAETYQFDRPMNGYQGFSGAYHCSYIKTPKEVCSATGKCKRVWELLQTCQ